MELYVLESSKIGYGSDLLKNVKDISVFHMQNATANLMIRYTTHHFFLTAVRWSEKQSIT